MRATKRLMVTGLDGKLLFVLIVAIAGALLFATPAGRSLIGIAGGPGGGAVKLRSNITLISEEDRNNNKEIDAGDSIRFTYTIQNTTKGAISGITLQTNINRQHLNFIRNLKGATGYTQEGSSIAFPNIHINPTQQIEVMFDATINYGAEDMAIATQPELMANANTLASAQETSVKVKHTKAGPTGGIGVESKEEE